MLLTLFRLGIAKIVPGHVLNELKISFQKITPLIYIAENELKLLMLKLKMQRNVLKVLVYARSVKWMLLYTY